MHASANRAGRSGRLVTHFTKLVALPEPHRGDYLTVLRARDPGGSAELESLLRAARAADRFLESGPGRAGDPEGAGGGAPPLQRGARVGAWSIVRPLGRGGTSDVYEARSVATRETGALKVAVPGGIEDPVREARLLRRIEHSALPRVLDHGADTGGNFCVLELIEGRPLVEHCAAERATADRRLGLFLELCAVVAHAHERGIVHRDLTPANVLVDRAGRVRLIDFGIAAPVGERWSGASAAGRACGTPDYASPEQLAGAPAAPTDDVYALGVLLFELVVERKPWPPRRGPFAAALSGVRAGPPARAGDAAVLGRRQGQSAALGRGLDRVVARCLSERPEDRYASAALLASELAALRVESTVKEGTSESRPASYAPLLCRQRCRRPGTDRARTLARESGERRGGSAACRASLVAERGHRLSMVDARRLPRRGPPAH